MKTFRSLFLVLVLLFSLPATAVVPVILGIGIQYWALSIGLHAAVFSMSFRRETQIDAMTGAAISSPFPAPIVVHLAPPTQVLSAEPEALAAAVPTGWTPPTGQAVDQGGETIPAYAPRPPIELLALMVITHGLWNSPYACSNGKPLACAPSASADAVCTALKNDYDNIFPGYTWTVFNQTNTLCSLYKNGAFYANAYSLEQAPDHCETGYVTEDNFYCHLPCPSGQSINPDMKSCSPNRLSDGTTQIRYDAAGQFFVDPTDPDQSLDNIELVGNVMIQNNGNGSYSTLKILSMNGEQIATARFDSFVTNTAGELIHSKTIFLVQCGVSLCVDSLNETNKNTDAVGYTSTDTSSDAAGQPLITTSQVGSPPGGSGGIGYPADYARQGTQQAVSDSLTSLLGLFTALGDLISIDDSVLPTKELGVAAITPVSVGDAGSCPAPHEMSLGGKLYYKSFTVECNYANGIRPVLLAFAWLMAAGILIGGFKNS